MKGKTPSGTFVPVLVDAYGNIKLGGNVTITIGSSTFTASPIFSDASGSTTLALVDANRRIVVNIGSDTMGLLNEIASVTAEISNSSATSTADLTALQASLSAKITEAIAQQATETIDILAAQASTTTQVGELKVQQASETLDIIAAQASGTLATNNYAAQDATQTSEVLAAIGSNTVGLATPTITNVDSTATSATVSNIANRLFLVVQNNAATESAFVDVGLVATPGFGIEIFAGSSILRPWSSDVAVSYASTGTVPLTIDQEVQP